MVCLPRHVVASIIMSFGGLLFGFDTGCIGPVTSMQSFASRFGTTEPTLQGIVTAIILIPAALSSILAGSISDIYGRPYTAASGAFVFGCGTAIESAANNLAAFMCGRVITGLGQGLFISLLSVYVCEMVPAERRGPLASLPQLFVSFGLALGYFIAYGSSNLGSSASWRIPFAVQSFLAFSFAIGCLTLPHTPAWLLAKGRTAAAVEMSAQILGRTSADILEPALTHEQKEPPETLGHRLRRAVKDYRRAWGKDVRGRTLLGCFMMIMQQLSGIDGVLYYAPLLFEKAGLSSSSASFLASGVSALVIFVVTIPAILLADHWSRRTCTILGGTLMSVCMFLIGSLYAADAVYSDRGAARWVVVVTIYLYAIFFNVSWAVIFRVYISEIQPLETRAGASGAGQSANWFANFIVALTTPIFLAHSRFGVYFFFGSCSLLTIIVCWFFMPETRGIALDHSEQPLVDDVAAHDRASEQPTIEKM